jgi:hypothetical protein
MQPDRQTQIPPESMALTVGKLSAVDLNSAHGMRLMECGSWNVQNSGAALRRPKTSLYKQPPLWIMMKLITILKYGRFYEVSELWIS